jgi:molybdopterin converting factor subunit 1
MSIARIQVRFFAAARDIAGCEQAAIEIEAETTVASLRSRLVDEYPALAALLKHSLLAVGQQYATDQTVLSDGDEVALIPPVSGG